MRIVSLAPSNTEILYALGLGRHIVGVTHFCDYPVSAKRKPKVGSWTSSHVDAVRSLKPDLIFTSYYLPPELHDYEGPGELIHLEPRTLGGIFSSMRTIGRLCGKSAEAGKLVRSLERELYAQIQNLSDRSGLPRVYAEEWGYPPMASGNWVPELIAAAGGQEILVHPGEASREVAARDVEREDPDLIILNWCGAGDRADVAVLAKRPGWKNLRAVREGNVVVIHDSLLNRPGPRIVEGAAKLRTTIASYSKTRPLSKAAKPARVRR